MICTPIAGLSGCSSSGVDATPCALLVPLTKAGINAAPQIYRYTPLRPQVIPTCTPLPVIVLLAVSFIETPSRLPKTPPQVPFVDCPCCVPELFEMGGDIDCDFKVSAAPIPTPVDESAPTAAPVTKSPTIAPDDSGGNNGNNGNRNVPVDVQTPAPPAMSTTSPPTVPPVRAGSEHIEMPFRGGALFVSSSAHEALNQ